MTRGSVPLLAPLRLSDCAEARTASSGLAEAIRRSEDPADLTDRCARP